MYEAPEFNFTKELFQAAKNNKAKDTICEPTPSSPTHHQILVEGKTIPLPHHLLNLLETDHTLFYFFANNQKNPKQPIAIITIYCFRKTDGIHSYFTLPKINAEVSCLTSSFYYNCPQEKQEKNQKRLDLILIIGTEDGQLKWITFEPTGRGIIRKIVKSMKIQHKSIKNIKFPSSSIWNEKNICFVLVQDSKMLIVNLESECIVAIFQPPVMSSDLAINFDLHISGQYLVSFTQYGQIYFWKLQPEVSAAIELSDQKERRIVKSTQTQTINVENSTESIEEIMEERQCFAFQAKFRSLNIFPIYTLHSASIHGLKWLKFYGNLVVLITSEGIFKIIAINFQFPDSFVTLLEYQIVNGKNISSVEWFPLQQSLIVCKVSEVKRETIPLGRLKSQKKDQKLFRVKKEEGEGGFIEKLKFNEDLKIESVQSIQYNNFELSRCIVSADMSIIVGSNNQQFNIQSVEDLNQEAQNHHLYHV